MYLIYKAGIRPSKCVARGGVAYMDVGKGREQERKLFRRIRGRLPETPVLADARTGYSGLHICLAIKNRTLTALIA